MIRTRPLAPLALAAVVLSAPAAAIGQSPGDDERRRIEKREVLVFRTSDDEVVEIDAAAGPRGYLGVNLLDLTPELRSHFGVPEDRGVLVSRVIEDSPAARRGLRPGDIVIAADGRPVPSGLHLSLLVADAEQDQEVDLECWRDRRTLSLRVPVEIRERTRFDVSPLVRHHWSLQGPHVVRIHSGHEESRQELEWVGDAVGLVGDSLTQTAFLEQLEAMRVERGDLQAQIERLEQRLAELEAELRRLDE